MEESCALVKCMICGDSKVGKSHLFATLANSSLPSTYTPTVFDTLTKSMRGEDGIEYNLGLWDSAGDKLFDEIRPICYPHTDCFIICYAVNDRESFKNVQVKWKPEILRFGDGPMVPIILAGLKVDLRESISDEEDENDYITKEEGESLSAQIGATYFFEVSTCHDSNSKPLCYDLLGKTLNVALSKKRDEEKPPNPIWGFEDLKILVLGDSGVGKSSILNAYTSRKPIKTIHQSTTEVVPHFQDVILDGIEFFLGIYDLPSGPEFLPDRIKEYEKVNGIILCYAINDPFSFQNIESQWLSEIRKYSPIEAENIPCILVGNKSDLKKETDILIPYEDGEELCRSNRLSSFIECSAKSLENISDIFNIAAQSFRQNKKIPIHPVSDAGEES